MLNFGSPKLKAHVKERGIMNFTNPQITKSLITFCTVPALCNMKVN